MFLNYEGSDFPTASYAEEEIIDITGELWIAFQLNRPLDDDDNADDPARLDQLILPVTLWNAAGWSVWWPFLPGGPDETYAQYFAHQAVKYKQKIFEERVAPVLAEQLVGDLQITAVSRTGVRVPLAVDPTLVSTYARDTPLYVTVRLDGPGQRAARSDRIRGACDERSTSRRPRNQKSSCIGRCCATHAAPARDADGGRLGRQRPGAGGSGRARDAALGRGEAAACATRTSGTAGC